MDPLRLNTTNNFYGSVDSSRIASSDPASDECPTTPDCGNAVFAPSTGNGFSNSSAPSSATPPCRNAVPFRKRKFTDVSFSSSSALDDTLHDESHDQHSSLQSADDCDLRESKKFLFDDSVDSTKAENEISSTGRQKTKAEAMMAKMGFKKGKGLGREHQGRADAIQVEMRQGRRGLGAEKTGLEPSLEVTWDHEKDEISVEETVDFAPTCPSIPFTEDEDTSDWIRIDERVHAIDDQTHFVDPKVLRDMLDAKSVFDELDDRDLRRARAKANPFETIKGAFFQNRAAMKMANLDAVLNFELTSPKPVEQEPSTSCPSKKAPELFYFADVCAGPGGFTEYVLWKKNGKPSLPTVVDPDDETGSIKSAKPPHSWCPYSAHGFGMTLTGKDDFKLQNMLAASPEMFETHYGLPYEQNPGCNGDGDVTNPTNIANFTTFVRRATEQHGVHLFMADGGFSVEGKENIQEILSKRLYLCQILVAFKILAVGGNLVCKLFDVFTPFSAGLLYLMWLCFEKLALHKPNTSRPANSERYVIGLKFRHDCEYVIEHLWQANLEYDKLDKSGDDSKNFDVIDLVPLDRIKEATSFYRYLLESNNRVARWQTHFLHKYKAFARNSMLIDPRQENLRELCLKYWQLPDKERTASNLRQNANDKFYELCNEDAVTVIDATKELRHADAELSFLDPQNFFSLNCLLITTKTPCLIIGLGGPNVFCWEGSRWDRLINFNVQLPKDTLLFGEFTFEFLGETKNANRKPILRVLDGCFLNGKSIAELPFRIRHKEIAKFCSAIGREFSRNDLTIVRCAEKVDAEHICKHYANRLKSVVYRNDEKIACLYPNAEKLIHIVGILFYNCAKFPWAIHWSKTHQKQYLFNSVTKESSYEGNAQSYADFKNMLADRRTLILPPNVRSLEGAVRNNGKNNDVTSDNHKSAYLESFLQILRRIDNKRHGLQ